MLLTLAIIGGILVTAVFAFGLLNTLDLINRTRWDDDDNNDAGA